MDKQQLQRRYFTTYTGTGLPLKLLNELDQDSLDNRITYFVGYFDAHDRLMLIEKIVYGEIEFSHQYEYQPDNTLSKAVLIEEDEPPRTLVFDASGQAREAEAGG